MGTSALGQPCLGEAVGEGGRGLRQGLCSFLGTVFPASSAPAPCPADPREGPLGACPPGSNSWALSALGSRKDRAVARAQLRTLGGLEDRSGSVRQSPHLARIMWINDSVQGAVSPGPFLQLSLQSVSPRITQQKKYCVTCASNNPEDDFETWKNVYYVSEKNKTLKAECCERYDRNCRKITNACGQSLKGNSPK